MSPPRGGDSWKWSETENQSKPIVSANVHSLRISSSGPPMCPMWIPKVIAIDSGPRALDVERPGGERYQPVAVAEHPGLRHADALRATGHRGLDGEGAAGDDGQVLHLDLQRHAHLAGAELCEQRGAHRRIGQAVRHAAVQRAVGVQMPGLDGQLEARAAVPDGLRAHAEQLGERPGRSRPGHYLKCGSMRTSIRYGPPLASARPIAPLTSPAFSTRSPGTPSDLASPT